jgi:hypothetical protein
MKSKFSFHPAGFAVQLIEASTRTRQRWNLKESWQQASDTTKSHGGTLHAFIVDKRESIGSMKWQRQ